MLLLAAAVAVAAPVPRPGPDWVTVKGTVVWPEREKVPERKRYDPTAIGGATGEYLSKAGAVTDDTFLIDEKSRGLKNVVVWIRPDDDDPEAKFPAAQIHPDLAKAKPAKHTLTNDYCKFDKRVLPMRVGDTLEVVSNSKVPVAFRVAVWDAGDSRMSLLKEGGEPLKLTDLKPGTGYFDDVLCNWKSGAEWPAKGRLWVFDHPYFAVTNDLGEFEIKQVPKGKWRIMYNHESGWHKGKNGRLGFPVEVEGDRTAEMRMKPLAFEMPKK